MVLELPLVKNIAVVASAVVKTVILKIVKCALNAFIASIKGVILWVRAQILGCLWIFG